MFSNVIWCKALSDMNLLDIFTINCLPLPYFPLSLAFCFTFYFAFCTWKVHVSKSGRQLDSIIYTVNHDDIYLINDIYYTYYKAFFLISIDTALRDCILSYWYPAWILLYRSLKTFDLLFRILHEADKFTITKHKHVSYRMPAKNTTSHKGNQNIQLVPALITVACVRTCGGNLKKEKHGQQLTEYAFTRCVSTENH